jgi:hypothetical protein
MDAGSADGPGPRPDDAAVSPKGFREVDQPAPNASVSG